MDFMDDLQYCSISKLYADQIIDTINDSNADSEVKDICISIVKALAAQRDKNVTDFKKHVQ